MELPRRQRAVLIARVMAGYSVRETATLMRCAEGTVKPALAAALRNVRRRLDALD